MIGLAIAINDSAFGNGGSSQDGIPGTGNATSLDPKKRTNVSIADEKLTIDLHQDFAEVEVRYKMVNSGPTVAQGFYFPIEKWLEDLTDYHIQVDGKELSWTDIGEKPTNEQKQEISTGAVTTPFKAWKKSVIPFASGQSREVVIHYKAAYAQFEESVSDDESLGDACFVYSLSPAATWKGPIHKGTITINVLHPEPEDVSFSKPGNRFAKITDTQYVWNFKDLTPTLDDDIKIVSHRGYSSYPANNYHEDSPLHGNYIIKDKHYYYVHSDYEATASSTLEPQGSRHYDVSNIKAENPDTAWATPSGVGATLTLDVKRPLPLDAILVVPGYKSGQNPSLWLENSRVAQVEVTLNGEYSFKAAIPDEMFDRAYPIRIKGYTKPVKNVRMIIKAVYPGTKYQDTCISLVELRGELSRKPEIRPAR